MKYFTKEKRLQVFRDGMTESTDLQFKLKFLNPDQDHNEDFYLPSEQAKLVSSKLRECLLLTFTEDD